MSRFTNQPCGTCNTDTLHYVHKCTVCGEAKDLRNPVTVAFRRIAARSGMEAYTLRNEAVRGRSAARVRGFRYAPKAYMKRRVQGLRAPT